MRKLGILLVFGLLMLATSCTKAVDSAGYEYAPDMYRSVAVEAYEASNLETPINTIKLEINSVKSLEIDLEEGSRLYSIACLLCHGETGQGDGILVTKADFAQPPVYNNFDTEDIYKVIHDGKGMMGSYTEILDKNERWQVVNYVLSLQES